MQVKGILFDLDGTLINTSDLIIKTFEETVKNVLDKEPSKEEITRNFGLPLAECLRTFDAERVEEMVMFYRAYNAAHHDEMVKAFPQVGTTVAALKESGIKMAVVTSKKAPMAVRGLDIFHLRDYFEIIIGCDDVENHKPHPEPMAKGISALGLAPEECICVGDSPFDLQSGRAAGCQTAAVRWSYCNWDYLLAEGKPDFILNSMSDLLALVVPGKE